MLHTICDVNCIFSVNRCFINENYLILFVVYLYKVSEWVHERESVWVSEHGGRIKWVGGGVKVGWMSIMNADNNKVLIYFLVSFFLNIHSKYWLISFIEVCVNNIFIQWYTAVINTIHIINTSPRPSLTRSLTRLLIQSYHRNFPVVVVIILKRHPEVTDDQLTPASTAIRWYHRHIIPLSEHPCKSLSRETNFNIIRRWWWWINFPSLSHCNLSKHPEVTFEYPDCMFVVALKWMSQANIRE